MQDVSHNCHHNTLISNPTYHGTYTLRYTPNTSTGEPSNNYCLAERRTLQSDSLINHLPCSNQQQQYHNPNICLNDQETASIEQLQPVISETSLLASMMVEQFIIQAVISSI